MTNAENIVFNRALVIKDKTNDLIHDDLASIVGDDEALLLLLLKIGFKGIDS